MFTNALKAFMRTRDPGRLIDVKTIFPYRRDGAIVFEECLDRGLIDPETMALTKAGEVVLRAKASARTPLQRAKAVLDDLLARAMLMNADDNQISNVDEIWLFGSVLREEETVGDIDLAMVTSRKPRFAENHAERESHARSQVEKIPFAPQYCPFPWERESWLRRNALYGRSRHPLLAGVQDGTSDLASLAVPCRLIFDRTRGGRVQNPTLDRHPESTGRHQDLEPPASLPDLSPGPLRPMDGRWISGYTMGYVSPYDLFRGWTDEAHQAFGQYPQNLRICVDGDILTSFPWTPKRLKRPGLDGRRRLLLVDATAQSGISVVLERTIETTDEDHWTLCANLADLEISRGRKRIAFEHTLAIVSSISVILAADCERMIRRAQEMGLNPQVSIQITDDGSHPDIGCLIIDFIEDKLAARAVAIEPDGWNSRVRLVTNQGHSAADDEPANAPF
ncbi:hypothetical protein ADT71_08380 [Novosphingobium sp. ST904]|nr:hypothetical protein ADT71_08380 [Novosphingobium sp. ST904]